MYDIVKIGHDLRLKELILIWTLPFIHLNFMTFSSYSKGNTDFIAVVKLFVTVCISLFCTLNFEIVLFFFF